MESFVVLLGFIPNILDTANIHPIEKNNFKDKSPISELLKEESIVEEIKEYVWKRETKIKKNNGVQTLKSLRQEMPIYGISKVLVTIIYANRCKIIEMKKRTY